MKVLIVLAMAVAAGSAAFTGSLLQESAPFAKDVFGQLKADVAVKSLTRKGANVKFQNEFVNAMESHVSGVLGEMDSILHAHETVSESVNEQLAALAKELEELIAAYEANPNPNHEEFQAAYAALIQKILALVGLEAKSTRSDELLSSLELTETIFAAIRQTLGDNVADQVIANMPAQRLGARGIWDDIVNGIENALDTIGLGNIGQEIGNIVNAISNAVKDKLKALRQLVEKLFSLNWEGVAALGRDAAQVLLNTLAPHYCTLANHGATLVSKLIATYTGLTIPPAIIVAVGGKIYEIISGNPSTCD